MPGEMSPGLALKSLFGYFRVQLRRELVLEILHVPDYGVTVLFAAPHCQIHWKCRGAELAGTFAILPHDQKILQNVLTRVSINLALLLEPQHLSASPLLLPGFLGLKPLLPILHVVQV